MYPYATGGCNLLQVCSACGCPKKNCVASFGSAPVALCFHREVSVPVAEMMDLTMLLLFNFGGTGASHASLHLPTLL